MCLDYKFNDLVWYENYQHGGSYNAYTSSETTNFYFDVNVDNFEEALDR
jgi:secreted Zn-dependent insulinase-like peptidase